MTSDPNKVGTYPLTLYASHNSYPARNNQVNFVVIVADSCTTTAAPPFVGFQTPFIFDISSSPQLIGTITMT